MCSAVAASARLLDARTTRPVRLVALNEARLPQPDRLAVDDDRGLALGVGDLVAEMLGLLAHEAVDGEREKVRESELVVVEFEGVQLLEPVDRLAREELGVAVQTAAVSQRALRPEKCS